MSDLFSYYQGPLADFLSEARSSKDSLIKTIISSVSERLVSDLLKMGISVDTSYSHTLDNNAVNHAIKNHGSKMERLRGQVPIEIEDLLIVPVVVSSYESFVLETNRRGQDVIIYKKTIGSETYYYVEEIRRGRKEFAACTMYKRKKESSPTLIE